MFEINTATCEWGTWEAPLLESIRNTTVRALVLHDALTADNPAQAHVALQIGDQLVDERFVDIPGPGGVVSLEGTVDNAKAGDTVMIHLHNHGANDWRVARVETF